VEENNEHIQFTTARYLANLIIESKSSIYRQWFPGDINSISDSLSRNFHVEANSLCTLLSENFSSQVPFGLRILPLPNEVVSWVTSLLLSRPSTTQWLKEPVRSSFARGVGSKLIYNQLGSLETLSLTTLTEDRNTKFSVPLGILSEGRFSAKPTKLLKSESVHSSLDCEAQAIKLAV
jgi:hypothetical protein